MGMTIGSIKPSIALVYNGELYVVIDCEHSKLARGAAFCRVKIRNMRSAQTLECTLRDSDNVEEAFIEKRKLQYSYNDDHHYHFLDLESYENLLLAEERISDKVGWLKDNLELIGLFYGNELLDLELPTSVVLKVVETDPGYRGNTVRTGTKPAKLETGVTVGVPLFIEVGDMIKVDTRTKDYMERA
ncbi:MAG: elongation factor P [Candidatus Omnitrophica bacterium]|nr:elongation factor P [Candidatus Omnitrophota bacterium]